MSTQELLQEESSRPGQEQNKQPGEQSEMRPTPKTDDLNYKPSEKLKGKVAIITGGDSGIGQAVAILFAKEGAKIVINYLEEHNDAEQTKKIIENNGSECLLIPGDVGDEEMCKKIVQETINHFGKIDIVINNAAEQHLIEKPEDITREQLERTFQTNIFSYFYLTKHALPYLKEGSSIINTTSVTAYKGNPGLLDYSATKGAIVTFTRSLSQALIKRKIRVNAVAPGAVWTPLIPASFPAEKVEEFGNDNPMERAGEPVEIAPCYLFLACNESSFMTGQVLHPNGGVIVNG